MTAVHTIEQRPLVPPTAGTAAIGAVVRPLATAIALEEGEDLSSMSRVLSHAAFRLLLA